jgi:hypothetical protein
VVVRGGGVTVDSVATVVPVVAVVVVVGRLVGSGVGWYSHTFILYYLFIIVFVVERLFGSGLYSRCVCIFLFVVVFFISSSEDWSALR